MALAQIELGRLAIMQRSPLRYVERRIEHLDLPDDYHYSVAVTQQLSIPKHGRSRKANSGMQDLLVPIGQFSKDQMPDLRVLGPDGTVLPLLNRRERGNVGATLFTTRWQRDFANQFSPVGSKEEEDLWNLISETAGRVVMNSADEALLPIYRLKGYLVESLEGETYGENLQPLIGIVLAKGEFWRDLRALAKTRLLVAKMRGEPGCTYVVSIEYTERFHYLGYSRMTAGDYVRKALAWLGLIGIPIARSVANLGQAASLWVVQSVPEGAEALRYYWKKDSSIVRSSEPVSVESTRAVVSRRQDEDKPSDNDLLLLDVQISPSSALAATIALAALLLVVSTYVFQALPTLRDHPSQEERAILVGLGSIFAAVPAGIAGALAYRGQTFVRRASRGPRVLLALLSGQAAFFAAVVSLKNLGDLAEGVAYILSIYSLAIIGIFSFIQLGPRWRKNERSRRKSATEIASPNECRRKQIWQALIFLGIWALVLLVFARTQAVLQHDHFFTPEFPGNVWRAWWSWFGLAAEEQFSALQCRASVCP